MKKRWIAIGLGVAAAAGLYQGQRSSTLAPPLTIHSGGNVGKLTLSPDGRMLAADTPQGQILLYDTVTGQQRYAFPVHTAVMIFSPDGHRLLTLSTRPSPTNPNGAVQVWDTATGAQISRFVPPGQTAARGSNIAALSPDLHWAVVRGGQRCTVYDIATGGLVKILPLPAPNPQATFSPDRSLLAISGGGAGGLQTWDTKTWRPVQTAVGQAFRGTGIRFSPDGARLALGSKAGLAWWNTRTWKLEGRFSMPSPRGLLRGSYYFSSDSRSLLVSQENPTDVLHQVDCDTGRETLTVPGQRLRHMALTGDRAEALVVPGKHRYFFLRDTYCIWDTTRRKVLCQVTAPLGPNTIWTNDFQVRFEDLSADGHVFAVGGWDDGIIRVWRLP